MTKPRKGVSLFLRIEQDLYDALETYCAELGTTKKNVIVTLLKKLLKKQENK